MLVTGTVGLSIQVSVNVENPDDEDAVEEALAAEGAKAFKTHYGLEIRPKDVLVFEKDGDVIYD